MSKGKASKKYLFQLLIVIGIGVYYPLGLWYLGIFELPSEDQIGFYLSSFAGITFWTAILSILVQRMLSGKLKAYLFILGFLSLFLLAVLTVTGLAGNYLNSTYSTQLFVTTLSHIALLSLIPIATSLILLNGFVRNSTSQNITKVATSVRDNTPRNNRNRREKKGEDREGKNQNGMKHSTSVREGQEAIANEEDNSGSSFQTGEEPREIEYLRLEIGQGKKPFETLLDDLILVEAADNYCKVHYLKNEEQQTELIRVKLKEVEDQVNDVGFFFRCHRSYLVNGHFVRSISGTSQNYRLHLEHGLEPVKVSRLFDLSPIRQLMERS